jgi:hypothetical protein
MKNIMLNVAIGAVMIASVAQALPTWPTSWTAVTVGGNVYQDVHWEDNMTGDNISQTPQPQRTDIVGNAANPAAYYAYDGQNLYFRVRVDGDASVANPQCVWSAVLNTDGDIGADWVIQLDRKTDGQVELAQATAGSPSDVNPWSALTYVQTPHTGPDGGVATDWYRYVSTGDSTTFPDTPAGADYFVDFAFDKATLDTQNGTPVNAFQVVFATSTTHVNSEKDLPDTGWSDSITVPEPTSMALLALGVTVLAMRRRKV